jgi:hypothetical protein
LLSRDGVIARYIFAFCFFFLSGSELITGWPATISGVLGTIEFTTAVLCYSPLYDLADYLKSKTEPQIISKQDKI